MFEFTDEQKMVQQMLRRWVTTVLAPRTPALERNELLPYDTMRDFAKAFGYYDMARGMFQRMEARASKGEAEPARGDAEEGPRGDPSLQAIVSMEMCRENPGFMLAFGATLGLAGGAILGRGTLAQKQRWGLPILLLEKIGAWAITEPGAGSDAFSGMRTVARPTPAGDGWIMNGSKTFITNAPYADTFVVYAKIDHGDGIPMESRPIQAFVLERGDAGLTTGKPMAKMGMHSSPTGEVFLSDVFVPRDRLLGEKEKEASREGARDVFHGERTGMMPMCLGIIERCLEDSLKYAKQRETWGKPIADYQLVQDKLARMYVARENVRNLLFKYLWTVKAKKPMSMAEASMCKLYCARVTTEAAMEAVQLMGGNGYMAEYSVERLARDAKLLQIGGGADEIQLITVAKALLKHGVPGTLGAEV